MLSRKEFNYAYAAYLNQDGSPLSRVQTDSLNKGLYGFDYYLGTDGKIAEVRTRAITTQDMFIDIMRKQLHSNPLSGVTLTDVDCGKIDSMMTAIYELDQDVRHNGGDMMTVDSINQSHLISILEKCGWDDKHISTIWIVLQHSSSEIMTHYFQRLKQSVASGALKARTFALMEDRLLMWNGYPQIYGTQISNDELYRLQQIDNIDSIRATVGLGPLAEYLEHFDLDFETEIAKLKAAQ